MINAKKINLEDFDWIFLSIMLNYEQIVHNFKILDISKPSNKICQWDLALYTYK